MSPGYSSNLDSTSFLQNNFRTVKMMSLNLNSSKAEPQTEKYADVLRHPPAAAMGYQRIYALSPEATS